MITNLFRWNTFIENYDFKEIISKYEANENFIIFIVFQDKNNFKTFSKFNEIQ